MLVVDRFTVSNFSPMDKLSTWKHDWLPKATHRLMVLIILRLSLVAHLNSIHILLSIAVVKQWPLYQLNIKNAFFYGDLQEKVYMLQPHSYEVQGET